MASTGPARTPPEWHCKIILLFSSTWLYLYLYSPLVLHEQAGHALIEAIIIQGRDGIVNLAPRLI